MENFLNSQVQNLKAENVTANQLLESCESELQRERTEARQTKSQLEREVANLKEQVASLRDELDRNSRRSNSVNYFFILG